MDIFDEVNALPGMDHHTLLKIQMTMFMQEQDGQRFLVFALLSKDFIAYSNLKQWVEEQGIECHNVLNKETNVT
jgi:hypothetical protein